MTVDNGEKVRRVITHGTPVLIVLHTPREKCWGILDEITPAGVFLRGLDLKAFDDWVPRWRVERISRDEQSGEVPSLYQQAEQRTGLSIEQLIDEEEGPLF